MEGQHPAEGRLGSVEGGDQAGGFVPRRIGNRDGQFQRSAEGVGLGRGAAELDFRVGGGQVQLGAQVGRAKGAEAVNFTRRQRLTVAGEGEAQGGQKPRAT
jgi:hypothetical protein